MIKKIYERCVIYMGIYLNPENESFQEMRNSKIYVDKSEMIFKFK